jgi:hypothetical protein
MLLWGNYRIAPPQYADATNLLVLHLYWCYTFADATNLAMLQVR